MSATACAISEFGNQEDKPHRPEIRAATMCHDRDVDAIGDAATTGEWPTMPAESSCSAMISSAPPPHVDVPVRNMPGFDARAGFSRRISQCEPFHNGGQAHDPPGLHFPPKQSRSDAHNGADDAFAVAARWFAAHFARIVSIAAVSPQ